jgi:hypothetical protein
MLIKAQKTMAIAAAKVGINEKSRGQIYQVLFRTISKQHY